MHCSHQAWARVLAGVLSLALGAGCKSAPPARSPAPLTAEEAAVVAQQAAREAALKQVWGGHDEGAPNSTDQPSSDEEKRVLTGLKDTLSASMPMFLDCYERESTAGARGPLLLKIVFDTRGEVIAVSPQPSEGLSPVITTCAVLTAWKLQLSAQPKESIVVTIALDFPSASDGPPKRGKGKDKSKGRDDGGISL